MRDDILCDVCGMDLSERKDVFAETITNNLILKLATAHADADRFFEALEAHATGLEEIFGPIADKDATKEQKNAYRNDENQQKLKQWFGAVPLSSKFLHYMQANLYGKGACYELARLGKRILASPAITDRLKLALFMHLRIIGHLWDRECGCYYICQDILEDFINSLDAYLGTQNDGGAYFKQAFGVAAWADTAKLKQMLDENSKKVWEDSRYAPANDSDTTSEADIKRGRIAVLNYLCLLRFTD